MSWLFYSSRLLSIYIYIVLRVVMEWCYCMFLKYSWNEIFWNRFSPHCRHCIRTCRWFHDDVIKWKYFLRYWPFVTGEFPSQRPVTRSFDVLFDLRLNKRLNKQSRRRWFEKPSPHYDVTVMLMMIPIVCDIDFFSVVIISISLYQNYDCHLSCSWRCLWQTSLCKQLNMLFLIWRIIR